MSKGSFLLSGIVWVLLGAPTLLLAQSDTVSSSGVTIVSSFRPSLKETPKISFAAPALVSDTSRPVLPYQVPDQQLLLGYTVRSFQPLAYSIDTARPFTNRSFVKAGYGNLRNPYLGAGLDLGDGISKGLSLTGRYFSLTQHPEARDMRFYRQGEVKADGYRQFKNSPLRLSSAIGFRNEAINHNLAYDTTRVLTTFPSDSLRQQFTLLSAVVRLSTTSPIANGISFSPAVKLYQFFDQRKNTETNVQLQAPLQKQIGQSWMVQTLFSLSWLRYTNTTGLRLPFGNTDTTVSNTLLSITPSIRYQQEQFQLQAGVSPTWNQDRFAALPQLALSYSLPGKTATLLAGWNARWIQNSYRELASLNPWMWAPAPLRTSQLTERYIGLKGQLKPRFGYDVRFLYNTTTTQPLFLNDTSRSPSSAFLLVYEDRLNQLQLHAQLSYSVADHFTLSSQLLFNHFFGLRTQQEAWGLLPFDWQTSVRVALTDQLWLQSDLVLFSGAMNRNAFKNNTRTKGAADLNAGLSFRVNRSLQLWAQFNNLFNQPYQRWNQNPVFGFNCSGGIVFSFNEKKNP
ncbi:MAG: hypothetical protein EBT80_05605 [Chitinophagales bacterium]|jgi:hypothetical protein|nr:hypothetical protein [Chitinophagales bacterium]